MMEHLKLSMIILIGLLFVFSCTSAQSVVELGSDEVVVPGTTFTFKPIAEYDVKEYKGGVFITKAYPERVKGAPTFSVGGLVLEAGSENNWLSEQYQEEDWTSIEEIIVGELNGKLGVYEMENGERIVIKAVLISNEQGLIFTVNTSLEQQEIVKAMLQAMLESVRVTDQ